MSSSETSAPRRKIFFNYRRADFPDFVERVRDWFALRYGRDSVFMDSDTIPPFTPFADYIRERVRDCDVLVAFIGPRWLEILKEREQQPDDPDYVRIEIKLALDEGKPIAPICIKGAHPPRNQDLPPDLRPMLEYNVAFLESGRHFLDNIEPLLDALERELTKLDALKVMAEVQTVKFDTMAAIQAFQDAADRQEWLTALDWLGKIRASGYVPSFYPLDAYEQQVRDALSLEQARQEYDIIRVMAQRSQMGKEDPQRIWEALLTFWRTQPGYDPDDLAAHFRPASAQTRLAEMERLATTDDLFRTGITGELLSMEEAQALGFIPDDEPAEEIPATMPDNAIEAPASNKQLLSLEQAQMLGFSLPWEKD
ncbi:MAG: TIR domain-containing protein [Anaerolineae bacterium]|nr:TIR domain-containing protein [Anaerolineae bacterium]